MSKTYVLLKDLPDCNAGSLAIWDEKSNAYRIEKTGTWVSPHRYLYYSAGTVQFTPEWFTIKEEKIEVISINQYTDYSPNYVINLNQDIPPDKYPSIKKAIEDVLNDNKYESQPISRDTWKHTDIQEQYYSPKLSSTDMIYTEKDLLDARKDAFDAARLTHPMVGVRYDTFGDYINALNEKRMVSDIENKIMSK